MSTECAREIAEQPEVLERQLSAERPRCEAIAARIRALAPRQVLIAARGSSDNAARYAQYLFGAHHRLPVALAAPSLFTRYGTPPVLERALVLGISQSGRSPDIVAVLKEARRQGALTVAVTNAPGSPLALAAEEVLPLAAGEERAVAATKSYTASLAALAMLSAALGGDEARWEELAQLPGQVRAALAQRPEAMAAVGRYRYADVFVVVGRGFNYATAHEVALKLKETCYVVAEPHSSADLRHGPLAMIDRGFPVVLLAPSSAVLADLTSLLELLTERRAEVVAISDRPEVLDRARLALSLPAGVPEWLSPIVAVVPGQLFALALSLERGLDPDAPRGLSKVTETR